jgi:hypothetical protein
MPDAPLFGPTPSFDLVEASLLIEASSNVPSWYTTNIAINTQLNYVAFSYGLGTFNRGNLSLNFAIHDSDIIFGGREQ